MKMKFPEKYIKHGDFTLHSGQRSNVKYEVEEVMTNHFYFNFILGNVPFSNHYVGITTGGLIMAVAVHTENPASKFSYVKDGKLVGDRPEGGWMLLDDVTTTGKSLDEAISIVGKKPTEILVVVDRRERNENPFVNSIFDL